MEITNLDAVEFNIDNKKHIRVYYQTKDRNIRETSYESDNGWFVRQTSIIAGNAMANSPITATRWIENNIAQIRVYYLNGERKICECKGVHNPSSGNTVWQSGVPLELNRDTNVASGSSLVVARPDRDDNTLRVFYQEAKSSTNSNRSPIREVKYRKNQNKWKYESSMITDALENTRLSAVSAGKAGVVRVYYQGTDNLLRVTLWDANAGSWGSSKAIDEDNRLAPRAPIRAVAWYESDAYDPDDLRVRVYTTLASSNKQVVEFARNGQNWEDPVAIANVEDVTSENSSIGVCRERTFNSGVPIFVFYKPKSSYIDLVSPQVQPALTAEAQAAYRPRGIPVSL